MSESKIQTQPLGAGLDLWPGNYKTCLSYSKPNPMVVRVLQHGNAGCVLNATPLVQGLSVPRRGEALIEIEFLTRFTGNEGGVCIYTITPGYIEWMAGLFPRLHFFAFRDDYDPDEPDLRESLVTKGNITTSNCPFSKHTAKLLGDRNPSERLFFISTTESPTVKLLYHALARPDHSLIRLEEIPEDYLEGEFTLPLYTDPRSSTFYLVVAKSAKAVGFTPSLLTQELSYFHAFTKHSGNYDSEAENMILCLYVILHCGMGYSIDDLKSFLDTL